MRMIISVSVGFIVTIKVESFNQMTNILKYLKALSSIRSPFFTELKIIEMGHCVFSDSWFSLTFN